MKKYLLALLISSHLICLSQESRSINWRFLDSTNVIGKCKYDTIKGIIFFHHREEYNGGNSYDSGYVVAECGAFCIMNEDISFIPGTFYVNRKSSTDGGETWQWEHEIVAQDDKRFYTKSGKRIPNKQVYALIRLR